MPDRHDNGNAVFAFDKSYSDLEALFKLITTDLILQDNTQPLFNDSQVKYILNNCRSKLDTEKLLSEQVLGFQYGCLGADVNSLVDTLKRKGKANLNHSKQILYRALVQKPNVQDQRAQLTDYFMILAELASHGDEMVSRDRTKCFVLFLLEEIMPTKNDNKRKLNPGMYRALLRAMGLELVETLEDQFDVSLAAKQLIVAKIIGNDSMASVVELSEAKAVAMYGKGTDGRILRPILIPIAEYWATDNFDDGVLSLPAMAEAYTMSPWDPSIEDQTTVYNEGVVGVDCVMGVVQELKNLLDGLAMGVQDGTITSESTATLTETQACATDLYLRALGLSSAGATVVTAASSTSFDETTLRSDSPRTIADDQASFAFDGNNEDQLGDNKGFGMAKNGLSISNKGLKYRLNRLHEYAVEKTEETYHDDKVRDRVQYRADHLAKNLEKKEYRHWRGAEDEPETDVERALTGTLLSLDDLEILRILGSGSFGCVLSVRLRANRGARAALKVECFNFADFVKHAVRECTEGSKIRHKNIVRMYGFVAIPDVIHGKKPICWGLLQEECGSNLKAIMDRVENDTCLSRQDKVYLYCKYSYEIVEAVVALNVHRVFHRDIKLENICEGRDGYIKLIDFGLARGTKADGTMTVGAGTPQYLPPEGSGGDKHDIYSTGIVFYFLLARKFPKWKAKWNEKDIHDDTVKAFDIEGIEQGEQIVELVLHMINQDEDERWDAAKVADHLKDIVASFQN